MQLVNNVKISISPGVTTNLVVRLINNTRMDELISLKLKLPKGWKCFSELKDIKTPNSHSTIKILSLNVPSYTLSGEYLIFIEAFDQKGGEMTKIKMPVTIEPKYALKIELINGPEYAFAGDTISVQFMLVNLSNLKAKINANLKGTGNDEKMNFVLNPDSSIFVTRKMVASKGIFNTIQKNVSFSASMEGKPEIKASNYYFYKLIPGNDVQFDPFNRFPIQFSTLFVSDNPGGKRMYAQIVDILGNGFIDEKKTKGISFHILGPDRQGQPLYGIYDEYFIEYNSPKSYYFLGDHSYTLSFLTEYERYARGGRAEQTFNHFTIGSFICFPRFYPNIKREGSIYARYSIPNKITLNIGYLNKLSNQLLYSHLATLNGITKPFKWANLNWEYALGKVGPGIKQAYRTEANINLKWIQLSCNVTQAEKNFPGYLTDSRYILANANITLSKKINVGANYSLMNQNLALDTLYSTAPLNKNLFLSVTYRFLVDGFITASYNYLEQQDRRHPMQFNDNDRFVRLVLNKKIKNFGFYLQGEFGKTNNLLLPEYQRINNMYREQLSLDYTVANRLNIKGFISYQKSKSFNVNDYKTWIYGGSINGSITKKLYLSFNYQSSYNIEEYYLNRSIMDGRLTFVPNKNNSIEISSRYYLNKNELNVKELAFGAKYVHFFDVPVSKKKNLGKLTGRIINKGVETIEGIVLSIGSDQAITDKNGNYSFPMLPAGNYYLMIDYSKAGVFAVPETPGPYQIEILPGRESRFDIGLTESAKITGEVSIQKEVSDEDKTYAGIRERLGKLLVEAKNGGEVYRIFTREDGRFAFESLRPGSWTVRVFEAGIPKEYELVTDQFNIGLASGKEEHIEVKIKEVRRRIKFQKTFETTPDFETTKPAVPGSKKTDSSSKNSKPVKTAKRVVKTPEKLTRIDTAQVKKQIRVVSVKGKESKSTSQNLEYRIQLGSYDKPLPSTNMLAEKLNITEKIQEDLFNGHYIYTIGSFRSPHEAAARNKEIQKYTNTTNSFIVSFRDGARTSKLEKPELAVK